MPKIPIPDPWRLNYPHFLGSPTKLRICYVFVIMITFITFLISGYYYYEYDKETTVEIDFFLKTGDEWDCKSIGTYNGFYTFSNASELPYNLEEQESPSIAKRRSFSGKTYTISTSSTTSTSITTYAPANYIDEWYVMDSAAYEITWGNAETTEICMETMQEYACANIHHPDTIIQDIHVYKIDLTFDVSYDFNNSFENFTNTMDSFEYNSAADIIADINDLGLFTVNDRNKLSYITNTHTTSFNGLDENEIEFWVVTNGTEENLCGVISDGINNGVIAWEIEIDGSAANSLFDIEWACEMISDDYCMINATDQFTFTDDNPLPTNTRMGTTANDFDSQILILGPDLGSDCDERWETVCVEYYDIVGYCERAHSPPYSCTKVQEKGVLTILSLSFATSQLVFTVLIIFISLMFKAFGTPVHGEGDDDEDVVEKQMVEMYNGTQQPVYENNAV